MSAHYKFKPLHAVETSDSTQIGLDRDWYSLSGMQPTSDIQSQPLEVTQERKRIGWHLLLTTLVIVALSAGLATALLLWVTVIHGVPAAPGKSAISGALEVGAFLVDEGTTKDPNSPQTSSLLALSFSSVTTQVISLTAPWLVMMTAYCIVGIWLTEQESLRQTDDALPTAAQFGFLVTLSSTAGIVAIFKTATYLIVGAYKQRREPAPRLFYLSVISVVAVYSMTHLISVVDLWLHLSSSTITYPLPLPLATPGSEAQINFSQPLPSNIHFYGVKFNDSLCAEWVSNNPDYVEQSLPCLSGPEWSFDSNSVTTAGELIASNTSFTDQVSQGDPNPRLPLSVITLHGEGDLAVIVPTSDPSLTWSGPTHGMRTSCRDVTPECGNSNPPNCSSVGYPFFPQMFDFSSNQTVKSFLGLGNNSVQWQENNLTGSWQPDAPYNVQLFLVDEAVIAICQVEYFNLTLSKEADETYRATNMTRTSDAFAGIMAGPILSGEYITRVGDLLEAIFHAEANSINFDGIRFADNSSAIAALNQEFSRTHLGVFAGSVIPASAFSVSQSRLISRYPVAPLLTYVFLLFLYSILVLAVFAWASTIESAVVRAPDGKETSSLQLGQSLLTDPLTLVGLALPNTLRGVDEVSPLKPPVQMFGEDSEKNDTSAYPMARAGDGGFLRKRAPRIMLGVVDEGVKRGMVYGLRESKKTN